MRLALYEPDIPQNAGALLRLGACLGVAVDIIEPCGFVLGDRRLKRAGLDYLADAELSRHDSWTSFRALPRGRLVLLTTQAQLAYHRFAFRADDTLLLGRETAGVPDAVHQAADARLEVAPGPQIARLQTAGVTLNHVVPMPAGGTFRTDTPAATGLVRGTSYVVVIGVGRARQTRFNWIVTGAAAALNIGLNLALIPSYGQMGAAIPTVAAYTLMFAGMTWNAHRLFPVPYQWRRVATVVGVAAGLTVLGKLLDVSLPLAIAIVIVYPLALALGGFYLPAERRILRRLIPAR